MQTKASLLLILLLIDFRHVEENLFVHGFLSEVKYFTIRHSVQVVVLNDLVLCDLFAFEYFDSAVNLRQQVPLDVMIDQAQVELL